MTEKTEECKICSAEGIATVFKDGRGLSVHLRSKHSGMKLNEYRKKYGGEKMKEKFEIEKVTKEKIPTEEAETPIEETPQETTQEIIITDYKLLNNTNLSAMFTDENGTINTFKKIIAIGNVEIENSSIVSTMIIGNNGLLTPTFIIPEFARIIEGDVKLPTLRKKKTSFFSKLLKKNKKNKTKYKQKIDENLSQELMTEFSKYIHDKKLEEEKL